MKILVTLAMMLIITLDTVAQPPNEWRRTYRGLLEDYGRINDICPRAEGGFAMTGQTGFRGFYFWLIVADEQGDIIFENAFPRDLNSSRSVARSVIQTDDGGYVMGGLIQSAEVERGFAVIRTNSDGELIWWRRIASGDCYAVIELKDGNLVACGQTQSMGGTFAYITKIDLDGNVIWEHIHNEYRYLRFQSIREIDGGFMTVGWRESLVCKLNETGELVESWQHGEGPLFSLISCNGDGFMACGGNSGRFLAIRIEQNGELRWRREFNQFFDMSAVAILPDGGFTFGGGYLGQSTHLIVRVDQNGNYMWQRNENEDGNLPSGGWTSIITDSDGFAYAVGTRGVVEGLLIKIQPDISSPRILSYLPSNNNISALIGDVLQFSVIAGDLQNDSLFYSWNRNNRELEEDDSQTDLQFDNIGIDSVCCTVSDSTGFDKVTWHVTVTDLYIQSHSPDTLNLTIRRGVAVDFTIDSVAATGGNDDVQFLWTKTNLDNPQPEETGRDAGATIAFLQSGNYAVEGLAYREQSSDAVVWNVSVKGAIWSFAPEDITLEVLPDSLVRFEVVPSEPENDSLSITWLVDGEVERFDETMLEWRFFGEADSCPPHLVQVVVADSVEADTVTWEVTVGELEVGDWRVRSPAVPSAAFLSVAPNPFNSSTTIAFSTGAHGNAPLRLAIYDLQGRLVVDFLDRQGRLSYGVGEHKIVWDGAGVGSGLYVVRLEAVDQSVVRKVLLIR